MDYSAALERVKVGVPATVEHPGGDTGASGSETAKWVAETTEVRFYRLPCRLNSRTTSQSFITFMDGLKLNLRAKDRLHPLLQNVVTGYARFKGSGGAQDEARSRLVGWLITLNGMAASEMITEEQSRQVSRTISLPWIQALSECTAVVRR